MLETERRRIEKRRRDLAVCCQDPARSGAPDCPVCTGQCPVRQAGATRTGRSREIGRRRTAKIHRTVRCAPDCPVSQRSAGPTVGRGICARHVAGPTVGRGHRTVWCAPDMSGAPTAPRSATVGCAILGRRSGTGQCPVCTGLSGAPDDRRQDQPSRIALNGS